MRIHFRLILLATTVACSVTGCTGTPDSQDRADRDAEADVASVYVVNYPLKYFAERIGGQHVDVVFPAAADGDPAFWTPDAETIVGYQQADLIFLNGASYAGWTDTVSLPDTKLVDTSASFADQYIPVEDAVTHTHGPGGEHAHGEVAFTTWLDPMFAIEQARAIAAAMTQRWPEHQQQFDTGFAALEQNLLELNAALEQSVSSLKNSPIVFSHPVYQYFGHRYELNGRSVHWEPDEAPTDAQWSELAELLKSHPAECMIWEGEPDEATVTRLREMGIKSVVFAPCGNTPEAGDYLSVMKQNAQTLGSAP